MMSKAEAYVFYASFHASDAREDGIDEKHELFRGLPPIEARLER